MKRNLVISSLLLVCLLKLYADQMQDAFTQVYVQNFWGDKESVSGSGSNLKQTETVRTKLRTLCDELNIKTIVDAACGDYNWMKELNYPFEQYIGIDIVPDLITRNNRLYASKCVSFEHKNITRDELPKADLIICRDCLVHLHFDEIKAALKRFKESGSTYLLITTFTKPRPNTRIGRHGHWRPLNMELPPFNLPEPILYLNENCTEANNKDSFDDKCLGLWRLADI